MNLEGLPPEEAKKIISDIERREREQAALFRELDRDREIAELREEIRLLRGGQGGQLEADKEYVNSISRCHITRNNKVVGFTKHDLRWETTFYSGKPGLRCRRCQWFFEQRPDGKYVSPYLEREEPDP